MTSFIDLGYRADSFSALFDRARKESLLIGKSDIASVFIVPDRPDLVIRFCVPADNNLLYMSWVAAGQAPEPLRPFTPVVHDMILDFTGGDEDGFRGFRSAILMERLHPQTDEKWLVAAGEILDFYSDPKWEPSSENRSLVYSLVDLGNAIVDIDPERGRHCPPDFNPDNIMIRLDGQAVFVDPMFAYAEPADIRRAQHILRQANDPLPSFPASAETALQAMKHWRHDLANQHQSAPAAG